jgi:hypothetical protein
VTAPATRTEGADPLLHDIPLPFITRLCVAGFRVSVATNFAAVREAALEAWGTERPRFAGRKFELRVIVQPDGDGAVEPIFRSQGSLLAVISDRNNFGTVDLGRGSGFLVVSRKTVGERKRFRWLFLESLVYAMLVYRAATPLHAACVERAGRGLLLCGPSGAGKSTLAFACARRGWSFVSDEASFLVREGSGYTVAGRPRSVRLRGDAARWFEMLNTCKPRTHTNGKLSLELATADFQVPCSSFCDPRALIRLRRGSATNRLKRLTAGPVVEELLAEIPSLGPEVRQRYEREIAAVARRGAWQLEYDTPDTGVAMLEELAGSHD